MNAEFWRGRRVFVTGHTGFKGAWLALWLSDLGARVTGYALPPPTKPSLFAAADVAGLLVSIQGDVCNLDELRSTVSAAKPEVVFHLAAEALVRRSYSQPVETYLTNVIGTVHMLEAMRACDSVRAAVIITSDKCYESRGLTRGCIESDPLGGGDPYSTSKACAELVTAAYRQSFFGNGPAVASARAGNVIGGGDWAEDRLVPDMVRAFLAGQPVRIRNPEATRPWQHVLEPLAGYLVLAERLYSRGERFAQAWNFGPGPEGSSTVRTVVEEVVRNWGSGASWKLDVGIHPHESAMLILDPSHAKRELGWSPRLSLAEAIAWTTMWYRDVHAGRVQALEFTLAQIRDYSRPFYAAPS